MKCPQNCDEIEVLHATPLQYIPSIIQNGFQHTKDFPNRASSGRGSAEENIFFFERYNPLGARYALSWMKSLEPHRDTKNGLIKATVCSCHFLDKSELQRKRKTLSIKGTDFIIRAHSYPETSRQWALDHFGTRLEQTEYYDDPMSFLRKIANDSDHVIYEDAEQRKAKEVIRYGIGDVLTFLDYDAADGYRGSHMFSDDRNMPMNELILTNPKRIYNIKQIEPHDLCKKFGSDALLQKTCENIGVRHEKK